MVSVKLVPVAAASSPIEPEAVRSNGLPSVAPMKKLPTDASKEMFLRFRFRSMTMGLPEVP